MMSVFWAIREGMMLRPYGAESASLLGKIPFGKALQVEVKQPRNSKHSRLYWEFCARIAASVGCDREDISDIIKLRTGHVRRIKTAKGIIELPKSISFAALDQEKFNEFFNRAVGVIENEIGIARPDALEAVKDLLEKDAA